MKIQKVKDDCYFVYFYIILRLELSLKPAEDLLNELSFLSKKKLITEVRIELESVSL
jgi:hypothetical protein